MLVLGAMEVADAEPVPEPWLGVVAIETEDKDFESADLDDLAEVCKLSEELDVTSGDGCLTAPALVDTSDLDVASTLVLELPRVIASELSGRTPLFVVEILELLEVVVTAIGSDGVDIGQMKIIPGA